LPDETPIQRSYAEMKQMPPEEIVRARKAGEFAELMAGRDPGRPTSANEPASVDVRPAGSADQGARDVPNFGQVGLEELRRMTPEQRVQARKEGRLLSLGVGR
jgi:hypothetical protein